MRLILSFFLILLTAWPAQAQGRFSLIRDAETEEVLYDIGRPVFEAAGLNPDNIEILIVNDVKLNAFVAMGQNVFMNAGILMAADSPDQVLGVIAHEAGHISGGHLARFGETLDKARNASIATFLLGTIAGIAAGRGDVAAGAISAGQNVATQTILGHSRTQERSADQAALDVLDKLQLSARGLYEFMKKLESQAFLISDNRDPYISTHPAVEKRISFIQNHIENSPHANNRLPDEMQMRFARVRGKVRGFLQEPVKTLREYGPADTGAEARYARAIALYRKPDIPQALDLVDRLLAESPKDAYFHELKGQILFENGRIPEARAAYAQAAALKPDSPLIAVSYAQTLVATNDTADAEKALAELNKALNKESRNMLGWRLKAEAHARLDQTAEAELSLAETFLLQNKPAEAAARARRAIQGLPENSPSWYRAQDIVVLAGTKTSD